MDKIQKRNEERLLRFLKALEQHVFVKSIEQPLINNPEGHTVTEEMDHAVIDQEAVIVIRGEWDRETLANILANLAK